MGKVMRTLVAAAAVVIALQPPARAQWIDHPDPRTPRLPNGKPNLTAPVPRTAAGRADLSGIWIRIASSRRDNPAEQQPARLHAGRGRPSRCCRKQRRCTNIAVISPTAVDLIVLAVAAAPRAGAESRLFSAPARAPPPCWLGTTCCWRSRRGCRGNVCNLRPSGSGGFLGVRVRGRSGWLCRAARRSI